MKKASVVWATLLAVAMLFAPTAQGSPLIAQDTHRKAPEEKVEKMKKLASECRELEFIRPIDVRVMDADSLYKKVREIFETEVPPERLAAYEKAYKAFRLLPPEFCIKETLITLYTEQVAGFYDPRTKELYVIDRASAAPEEVRDINEMLGKMMEAFLGMSQDDLVLLHELIHALQDQHFDLLTLPTANTDNDDLGMAIKALYEGDATYAMFEPVAKKTGINPIEMGVEQLMGGVGLQGTLRRMPEVIQQSLIFPYISGARFIVKLRKKGQLEAVNKAFHDLPSSTEQILHPEKYFEERDFPTIVTLPDLTKQILPGWNLLITNVLGELNVGVLLRSNWRGIKNSKKIAAGWDGDRFAYLESPDGKDFVLAWYSTWDSPEEATEFWYNYGKTLKKKKYPHYESLEEGETFLTLDAGKGRLVHIELRDTDVLAVEGTVDEQVLQQVVSTLWSGTTKEELKKVERVEPPAVATVTAKDRTKELVEEERGAAFSVETPNLSIQAGGLKLNWAIESKPRRIRLTAAGGEAVIDIRMSRVGEVKHTVRTELDSLIARCRDMLSQGTFGKPITVKTASLRGCRVEFEGVTGAGKKLRGRFIAVTPPKTPGKLATISLLCSPEHFETASVDMDTILRGLKIK